jgi:hypothetical protein
MTQALKEEMSDVLKGPLMTGEEDSPWGYNIPFLSFISPLDKTSKV